MFSLYIYIIPINDNITVLTNESNISPTISTSNNNIIYFDI